MLLSAFNLRGTGLECDCNDLMVMPSRGSISLGRSGLAIDLLSFFEVLLVSLVAINVGGGLYGDGVSVVTRCVDPSASMIVLVKRCGCVYFW